MMVVSDVLVMIAVGIWVFIPAMVPNTAAALIRGTVPVDFGRSIGGARILGDGKTWRGFIGGALFGVALGLLMVWLSSLCGSEDHWGFGPSWNDNVGLLFCLAFGSLIGDMIGSFVKRRLNFERGAKVPILDQFDYVFGAFLLVGLFYPQWLYATYLDGYHLLALLVMLFIVYAAHRIVNYIGWKMGVKENPW